MPSLHAVGQMLMDCITVDIHSCLVGELRVPIFFPVYSIFVKLENQVFVLVSSLGGERVFSEILTIALDILGKYSKECTLHYRVNSSYSIIHF